MEIQRVVEIYHPASGNRGSGYQVAGGLVLTARHAVHEEAPAGTSASVDDTCRVRWYRYASDGRVAGDSGWVDARVAWTGAGALDAALLVPRPGAEFMPGIEAVSLGQVSGSSVPVVAVGFPRAVSENERSDLLQVSGNVDSVSKSRSGALLIAVTSNAPPSAESWRGVSGAAVFAGDMLVGVITQVPGMFGSDSLQALRLDDVLAEPRAAALLQSAGVDLTARIVTAGTVAALPEGGRWEPLRARYAELVLTTYCRLDYAGLSDAGAGGHRLAASDAWADARFIHEQGHALGLDDLITQPRVLLIGGPGSGKSTTLKQILARAVSRPPDRRGVVPVWVPLAELPRDGTLTPARVLAYLVGQAREQLGLAGINSAFFEEALRQGIIVIAFDALDEAGGLARRQQVRDLLLECARTWTSSRMIVSVRPAQQDETPLASTGQAVSDTRFAHFTLDSLSREQVPAFLHAAFGDDGTLSRAILDRPELDALIGSPLTLSLLARVAQQRGELPAHRVELFGRWVETACIAWEEAKGGTVTDAEQGLRLDALHALAWALQTQADGMSAVTIQAARQTLAPLFGSRGTTQADTLLAWLVQRTGLLATADDSTGPASRRLLRFTHLQLQEYLAGSELARRIEGDGVAAMAVLAPWWFRSEWLEVFTFTVCVLSSDGELHNTFLRELVAQPDRYDDLLHRRILLAAALLAQADLADDDVAREVVEGLSSIIFAGAEQRLRACELLLTLAHHPAARPPLNDLAGGGALAAAIAAAGEPTRHDEIPWRIRAAEALGQGSGRQEALLHLDRLEAELSEGLAPAHGMEWYAYTYITGLNFRLQIARRRYEWGQTDAVLQGLAAMFGAARELADQRAIVEALDSVEERAAADTLLDDLVNRSESLDLPTAVWCWHRGRLRADSPLMIAALKAATSRVEQDDPNAFSAPDDVSAALSAALELANGADVPELRELLVASLRHDGLVWYWAGRIRQAVPALATQATEAIVRSAADPALTDNSRRRGMVKQLCDDPDDTIAVPALLELLRHARALRWAGEEIVDSLRERGRTAEALAVLHEQVMTVSDDGATREIGLPLAERLVRGSAYTWLNALYRSGTDPEQDAARLIHEWNNSGAAAFARYWFVAIAAQEDGRAFLKKLTTHPRDTWFTDCARDALYGGVLDTDSWSSRDEEDEQPIPTLAELEANLSQVLAAPEERRFSRNVRSIFDRMVDIGARDAALGHAQAWLDALGPVTPGNAAGIGERIAIIQSADLWQDSWLEVAAQAARVLAPADRYTLMAIIESKA